MTWSFRYVRKEGISRPAPMQSAGRWAVAGLSAVVALVVLLMMLLWSYSARRVEMEATEAPVAASPPEVRQFPATTSAPVAEEPLEPAPAVALAETGTEPKATAPTPRWSFNVGALFLLVLLGAGVMAFFLRGRAGVFLSAARRPRNRHVVLRIIFGALGGAILMAVGIGTWRELRSGYVGDGPGVVRFHLPTKPAPPIPEVPSGRLEIELQRARVLVQVWFIGSWSGGLAPLEVLEYDVRLPRDRGKTFTGEFKLKAVRAEYALTPEQVFIGSHITRRPNVRGDFSLRWSALGGGGGARSGGVLPRDPGQLWHYDVVAGVIWPDGRVLIDRRPPGGLLGGLWEFPGGKLEAGETPRQALTREVREELDIEIRRRPARGGLVTVRHA